jgi:Xaa-Pro aminopeptidase
MSSIDTAVESDRALFDRARRSREGLMDATRLHEEIGNAGLDAVVATSHVNVIYTSGVYLPVEISVPQFVVTTASGERAAVVNEADERFVREYMDNVRAFRFEGNERAEAVRLLGEAIEELGLSRGDVGIELTALPRSLHELVERTRPHVAWADATPIFQRARLFKTPAEIELLAAAARATHRAIESAFADADDSATEKGLAAQIQANALLAGADGLSHTNVNAGVHSTLGHVTSLEERIEPGELVYVDFGAKFAGYCTDLARNAVHGEPSGTQRDFYDRMFDVHLSLIAWLQPGVTGGEVYDWAQAAYAKAGLAYPWGTFGHSIGLDMHEGFELSVGSPHVLEPGMVVCIELTHTEPDGRYHVEDMVAIGEEGAEMISNTREALLRSLGESA